MLKNAKISPSIIYTLLECKPPTFRIVIEFTKIEKDNPFYLSNRFFINMHVT